MKIHIIQPKYYTDFTKSDEAFKFEIESLDNCESSMDIIVLPESSDAPALCHSNEEFLIAHKKYTDVLMAKACETAKRCNSMVFVNAYYDTEIGIRNTTHAINRNGEVVGRYFKAHLTPGEVMNRKLDSNYSFEYEEPTIVEMEGLRFAFLTCYDFYFYEAFSNIARQNVDIIIGCSHQRSDSHSALEIMTRHLAYNTNAYVLRSSVTMDENSTIGGASMVVAPDGEILLNLKSEAGTGSVDIDPKKKYYKPGGYGNPIMAHYEYVEMGRRPYKYRPAGSAIVQPDDVMPYPRLCAHRGWKTVAPENSLPAFGAAIALGAEEIEFDLWPTKDGEIVSIHDKTLERVSDGEGLIFEHTYEELLKYDFGAKHDEKYKGLKIVKFEEILKKFSCHVIMNIHIKTLTNAEEANQQTLDKIIALIRKYDCERYVYFMCGNDNVLEYLGKAAPNIARCVGAGSAPYEIVDRAIKYGCQKVQLFRGKFTQEMVDKAKANGIICNVFYSDDPELGNEYLDMGIDTILTNDYQKMYHALGERMEKAKTKNDFLRPLAK